MATRKPRTTKDTNPVVLTAADILRGGDSRSIRQIVVPGITKGGKPGLIHYKPLKAGRVLGLMNVDTEDEKSQVSEMVDMLIEVLCNPDGTPLLTREQLLEVPVDVIADIMNAVSGMRSDDAKNV